jgi:hypothetical protein
MIIGFDTHIMPEMAARLSFFAVQHPTIWGFAKGSNGQRCPFAPNRQVKKNGDFVIQDRGVCIQQSLLQNSKFSDVELC